MTQEDKQLLLKDLSARLPYGVKVHVGDDWAMTLRQIDYKCFCECWENEDIKSNSRWMLPYLRKMSSMTEGEKHNLLKFGGLHISESEEVIDVSCLGFERHCEVQDWLNSHHFDYRGLIEKGLAIEVTEENNPYK